MKKFLNVLKNFYVVFSICMLVVVFAGISFGVKNYREYTKKNMALNSEYVKEDIPVVKEKNNVKKEVIKNEKPIEKKVVQNDINVVSVVNERFVIDKPVKGEIIKEFSGEELVYSETFDDYRVHNGIDISAKRSEPVFAVYDGVVSKIYADALCGIVIEVEHQNDYTSVYKNLSSDKMVRKGDKVKKGQTISGVGETAVFESATESHIHFELKKGDKYVNPREYINL